MSRVTIHQLVHGYRRGHELLAGSIALSESDAELTARLSDLSGTLSPNVPFEPYLNLYPLPSGRFYAVARTWLDENAPRAGCVLTHTLLIPVEEWRATSTPRRFGALLAKPDQSALDSARQPLVYSLEADSIFSSPDKTAAAPRIEIPDEPHIYRQRQPLRLGSGVALTFMERFFGEGVRPIVWLGVPTPEEVLWRLVEGLWPALRASLASCTLSFQPRSLDERPFDVLFAPDELYSRFHSLPSHHVLDASGKAGDKRRDVKREPWIVRCAAHIFAPLTSESSDFWGASTTSSEGYATSDTYSQATLDDRDVMALIVGLGPDPTEIRRLFLLSDLLRRIEQTPLAGVGAMDVLASLSPSGPQALSIKQRVVAATIVFAGKLSKSDEALQILWLVSERLDQPPFVPVRASVSLALTQVAEAQTVAAPAAALTLFARLLSRRESVMSPLTVGVLRGLAQVAERAPEAFSLLEEHGDVAPEIIAAAPQIALAYLRYPPVHSRAASQRQIAIWVESLPDEAVRWNVVRVLLPELVGDVDIEFGAELLKSVSSKRVGEALTILNSSTQGFVASRLRTVVEEQVARVYPHETRAWLRTVSERSDGVAEVVAATFEQSQVGFDELLGFAATFNKGRGRLVAAFLQHNSRWRLPVWLRGAPDLQWLALQYLLDEREELSGSVEWAISRLVEDFESLPVQGVETLWPVVCEDRSGQAWDSIRALAARSVTRHYLTGALNERERAAWAVSHAAGLWAERVSSRDVQQILVGEPWRDAASRERAWTWVARAPAALYQRSGTMLEDIVAALLRPAQSTLTRKLEGLWIRILRRARDEGSVESRVRLCAQALRFAFDHRDAPLGAVVAEGFLDVYRTVVDAWDARGAVGRWFGFFDWDKGKLLRQQLVDAFMTSAWSPGDLALAVSDLKLLRKIVKRLLRKSGGLEYLQRMLDDLRGRDDAQARSCARALAELMERPDYYEEWD